MKNLCFQKLNVLHKVYLLSPQIVKVSAFDLSKFQKCEGTKLSLIIYQYHCICWNILVSTISEMDDGRWKSVAHLRRVMFIPLVIDESYFFVSSNPPLLSCKSCSGNQPYFFFQFAQVKWHIHSTWDRLLQKLCYVPQNCISMCAVESPSCYLWLCLKIDSPWKPRKHFKFLNWKAEELDSCCVSL